MALKEFIRNHRGVLIEILIIFLVALVPRFIGIGQFLTADEPNWMGRSYEFVKAFRHLRINDTFQTTHPGITVMWIAGLSIYAAMNVFHTVFNFGDLLKFTAFARVPLAFTNTILIVLIFLVLRKIFPRRIAFIAGVVLALDPFLIGYSKLVHVDALLTGFFTLSGLMMIYGERINSKKIFLLSAIPTGLAILTKLPAISLIPAAFLILFLRKGIFTKELFKKQIKLFLQWLLVIVVMIFIFWPSLWFVKDPGNINQVRKDMTVAATLPHDMSEEYSMDAWHYPLVFLDRLTVPVQVGILALIIFLVFPKLREIVFKVVSRKSILFIAAVGLIFFIEMTVGGKKGDRYILPLFPLLDILGVVGLYYLVVFIIPKDSKYRNKSGYITAAIFTVPMILTLFILGPYALSYYNPLFPPNLSQELGWGEGMDQVAKYLDAQPGKGLVASWYPEDLRSLTKKTVLHINAHEQDRIEYVVLYRNMFGRDPENPANDFIDEYYKKREPVFVAKVNGLEYAWVYKKPIINGIVGEILPGQSIVVEIPKVTDNVSRIDLKMATYSGKAKDGIFTLRIRGELDGNDLRTVNKPVSELMDGGYTKFKFEPISGIANKKLYLIFTTLGTRLNNAPTLRVARDEKDSSYSFIKSGDVNKQNYEVFRKQGLIGYDWYFIKEGKEYSSLEAKL